MRLHPVSHAKGFAAEALVAGGFSRESALRITADYAGRCEHPVPRDAIVRPDPPLGTDGPHTRYSWKPGETAGWDIEFQLRCRQCGPCLKARRALWAQRAMQELKAAARTWFGTITLSPDHQFKMKLRAIARLTAGGTQFDDLSENERFREIHREINQELTRWAKRVRKNSGASLRMLLVVEKHQSGLPHYHALIHQVQNSKAVTYRHLKEAWSFGHAMFKLVDDERSAFYVTKYLAKDAQARVRASLGYGSASPNLGLAGSLAEASGDPLQGSPKDVNDDQRRRATNHATPLHSGVGSLGVPGHEIPDWV